MARDVERSRLPTTNKKDPSSCYSQVAYHATQAGGTTLQKNDTILQRLVALIDTQLSNQTPAVVASCFAVGSCVVATCFAAVFCNLFRCSAGDEDACGADGAVATEAGSAGDEDACGAGGAVATEAGSAGDKDACGAGDAPATEAGSAGDKDATASIPDGAPGADDACADEAAACEASLTSFNVRY